MPLNLIGATHMVIPGFLPYSRASFTLDVVVIAMVGVLPILAWSIYQVRVKRNYTLHKRVQLALGVALLVVVCVFEWDMRVNGWRQYAKDSAYYATLVFPVLYVHLCFAISTPILWVYVIQGALRRFAKTPVPNTYSRHHKIVARVAVVDMFCTAITGWTFYVLAFVA